jgi:hypothetical protein
MRTRLIAFAIALTLLGAKSALAGVYIPGEPPEIPVKDGKGQALPFSQFRLIFSDVIAIGDNLRPTDVRQRYLQIRDQLMSKNTDKLSEEEIVRLTGVLIRLRETDKAMELLQKSRVRFRESFPIHSHLALLFHLQGQPDAVPYQLESISMRPKEMSGYRPEQIPWFLRAERVLLDVFKKRMKEQLAAGGRPSVETPDAIFNVDFVGDSGQYEAGKLAEEQKKNLPDDAVAVVQQLLLWLPQDARLYWLLGELYNAQGDVAAAATIFKECADSRNFQPKLLHEHRRIVQDALLTSAPVAPPKENKWRSGLIIGGSIAALLFLALILWQIRLVLRRLGIGGECQTGH